MRYTVSRFSDFRAPEESQHELIVASAKEAQALLKRPPESVVRILEATRKRGGSKSGALAFDS
jgi:hypothetical protein